MPVRMTERTEKIFGINNLVEAPDGVAEDEFHQLQRMMNEGHARRWMEEHPAPEPEIPVEPEDPDAQLQRIMAEGRARRAAEAIPVYVVNEEPVTVSVNDPLDVKISNAILTGCGAIAGAGIMTIIWAVSMMF